MSELPDIEQKARSMGWLPEDQFRGRKEHWVDAEKYVERGEQFIPFLQAERRKLESELQSDRQKLSVLETSLREASETIEALKEFRTELNKERVEERKEQLVEGIKAAREAGDVAAEESLRDKLAEAREALKPQPKPEVKPNGRQAGPLENIEQSPAWKGFVEANPWWNDDLVMRASAVAIGADLAAKGKLDNLTQPQRLAAIAEATKERFSQQFTEEPRRDSRVEGGRGGVRPRDEGGQSFNDLPADAKDGAARFEARLVGKKQGQFPTVEAYRKNYAEEYFRRNPNG